MSCGTITRGSVIDDCEDLGPAGTRDRLILINYDDVDQIYTSDEGRIISIELVPGTVGYVFDGFRNDVKKSEEVIKREKSKSRFTHGVGFVIYDVTQVQKNNIRRLARGRVVAITEILGKDDDSIEVVGKECGMQIVDGQIRNAHEASGAFVINLRTPDNGVEFERKLPQSLGVDYDDALSIIDDLIEISPDEEGVFDLSFDQTFI